MTKLFVYGSLRKGCFNHHYIEDIAQFKLLQIRNILHCFYPTRKKKIIPKILQ